ncbi:MAG: hypothetical protein HY749_00535 [Gammaproteobacteria bacterium]|nr:hypothetical protein [Gammaproteobacteria bacterium]MBI5617076.1 hypothetical protein [Gammaproteobacteria bacterium]
MIPGSVPARRCAGPALAAALLATTQGALAIQVYAQPAARPAGGFVDSQQTIAADGLDSDSAAFDNVTLHRTTKIARMAWWGEGQPLPEHGFTITVYRQKPAVSEPAFAPEDDAGVVARRQVKRFKREAAGNDAFRFDADLDEPIVLEGGQPYWISIVGNMQGFAPWRWAAGADGDGRSFQWRRGAAVSYMNVKGDRAFLLFDAAPAAREGASFTPAR